MTDDLLTIRGTREESATLRWLHKAKAIDDWRRSILTVWHRIGDVTLCCDGFRLHTAETPECMRELPDTNERKQGNYRGRIYAGDFTAALERKDGTYPDISQIAPKGEVIAEVALDPRFLKEAVEGFKDQDVVILRVYDDGDDETQQPVSLHSTVASIEKCYALIMPRHMERDVTWTPEMFEREFEEVKDSDEDAEG